MAGMGLQGRPAAADEGSCGKSMVAGDVAPPALSTLDDGDSQPVAVDPGSKGEDEEDWATAPTLTLEQQCADTRAAFQADARTRKWMADGDAAQPTTEALHRSGAATGEDREERTGLGTGCGMFDVMYTPAEGDLPLVRYGRSYASESDWTPAVAQDWEERLTELRNKWVGNGMTVRLFKVGWQGRDLSREVIVRVLQQGLESIGGIQGNLAVYS